MKKERNYYFDIFKAYAAIFVILIHCEFPGSVGKLCKAFATFAVPYFFILSGFFCINVNKSNVFKRVKRYIELYLISGGFYLFIDFLEELFKMGSNFSLGKWIGIFSLESIVKLIITNTPIVYLPRWFLLALIYCYLFYLLMKQIKMNDKCLCGLGLLLMVIDIVLEYVPILTGNDFIFCIYNIEIPVKQIFIFRAFPWFMLGVTFRCYKSNILNISFKILKPLFVWGCILLIVQFYIMNDAAIYGGTYLIVVSMIMFAIKKSNEEKNTILFHVGSKLSMYIYLLHGAVISAMTLLERLLFEAEGNVLFSWCKPIIVIIISILSSEIVYFIVEYLKNGKKVMKKNKIEGWS